MPVPETPPETEAILKSLDAIRLAGAYLTWSSGGLLRQEILCTEPRALVVVGPQSARRVDEAGYPLARTSLLEASEGVWIDWRHGTAALRLPPLAPALEDRSAKRRFWQAFLRLRPLAH
ncbi:hypothetical protein E0L93_11190 [Rubrobacter taiwanensis]|jgi:hypothetical protein|uniref:Uncharacterized protein n=1 Tax=Rubrobacter taiwanensis TaxID=185139 RepID=A0A4R1BFU4_9ACTN|nr:hypothetical protein [Rubrobacter taiwanensis]TCJ16041.1 hypothetical protein E0L93_11190 [Rubrobacter taiwanensis]